MRRVTGVAGVVAFALGGCAASKPQVAADLQVAFDVASGLQSVYAAQPAADPKIVAELSRRLAAAQTAVTTWQSSTRPADQALASAAIAAVLDYEASAGVSP